MTEHNLQEIHDYMISVAEKAGDMITSAKPAGSNVDLKKNCRSALRHRSILSTST